MDNGDFYKVGDEVCSNVTYEKCKVVKIRHDEKGNVIYLLENDKGEKHEAFDWDI
jgi:hypothetical protein